MFVLLTGTVSNLILKLSEEGRSELDFCFFLAQRNIDWISKPPKGRATVQGTEIISTYKKLAPLIVQAKQSISMMMGDTSFWFTQTAGYARIWNTSLGFSRVYVALNNLIPYYEISVLWCIQATRSGMPDVFGNVVTNTPMVLYLVGEEIGEYWNQSDIGFTILMIRTLRNCCEALQDLASAIEKYYFENMNS